MRSGEALARIPALLPGILDGGGPGLPNTNRTHTNPGEMQSTRKFVQYGAGRGVAYFGAFTE